jgi:hypothetical protein
VELHSAGATPGEPDSKPTTRQIAHDALVKLHGGTDLGETRAAWQAWCTEVTKPER